MTGARRLAIWLGLVVSAALALLALRTVDLGELWSALGDMRWWTIAPALGVLTVGVFVRALRWRALFEPGRRPTPVAVTSALLIGNLFNSVLPARMGEPARVVALARESGLPMPEVVSASVLERVIDLLVLLTLLFVAVPFLPEVSWLRSAILLAAVLAAALLVAAVVLNRYGDRPLRAVLRPLGRRIHHERLDELAASLARGTAPLRHGLVALECVLLTALSWLLLALSNWIVLRGFGFDLDLGAGVLVVVATNLALVVPAGPGGLGPFEAAAVVALSAYGIGGSEALSYAIVLHAVNLVPYLGIGYAALHRHVTVVRAARGREPGPLTEL